MIRNFSSLLNFAWWLAIWAEYFHLGESYLEMCAPVDLLSRNYLHKLTKHVNSGIFWCCWLLITLTYVWPVEKSCHIYFFQKSHVCTMRLQVFNALYFSLGTQKPIFWCVHQYLHAKYSLWPFWKIFNILPSYFGWSRSTSQVYVYCENIISSDSKNVRK